MAEAIVLERAKLGKIRQNLAWALGYNVTGSWISERTLSLVADKKVAFLCWLQCRKSR